MSLIRESHTAPPLMKILKFRFSCDPPLPKDFVVENYEFLIFRASSKRGLRGERYAHFESHAPPTYQIYALRGVYYGGWFT